MNCIQMDAALEVKMLEFIEELRFKRKKVKNAEIEIQRLVSCYHELERVLESERTANRKRENKFRAEIMEMESKAQERIKNSSRLVEQSERVIAQQTQELSSLREQIRSMQVELRRWETLNREQGEKLEQMTLRNKNSLEALTRHQATFEDYRNEFATLADEHTSVKQMAKDMQQLTSKLLNAADSERDKTEEALSKLTKLEKSFAQQQAEITGFRLGFSKDKEIANLQSQIQQLELALEKSNAGEAMAREELEEQRASFLLLSRSVGENARLVTNMSETIEKLRKEVQMYQNRCSNSVNEPEPTTDISVS